MQTTETADPTTQSEPTLATIMPPSPPTPEPSPMAIQGGEVPPAPNPPTKTRLPKKSLFIGLAIFALFAGVGGYIFGFYLPNQPENVWNNGLKNSGQAISQLSENLTKTENLEKLKKSEVTVTVEGTGAGYDITGSLNSKFDTAKSASNAKLETSGGETAKINLTVDVLTETAEGKLYPDIYFKIGGLKAMGEESLFAAFSKYDNQWIGVSSMYLESLYKQSEEKTEAKKEAINSGDVAEAIKVVTDTSNEYLFSSNPAKAVLVNKAFKGKEVVDDVPTFHYEVGVNKDNAIAYCKALTVKINGLAITKKLQTEEQIKKDVDKVDADCKKEVEDNLKDGDTFDAWVNTKYKLMHKVRFYQPNDKTRYTEFGQIYKGGKNLNFFVASHDDSNKSDIKFVTELNTKDLTSKGTFTAVSKEDNGYDVKATVEIKPYSGNIKVAKPTGTIDIQTILEEIGLN